MSEINFRYLNATSDLVAFCVKASAQGWLALDTEFVRERTYYAQLGLLQLAVADEVVLLDPLADLDLTPLWQLVLDPEVVKVLHSGGEDLELLFQHAGNMPRNVLDTQIAATVLGHGDAMGYAALVEHYCQVSLDKTQSRTDWLQRPLSDEQNYYAAADVYYLAQIYPQLMQELVTQDRLALVADECALQIVKRSRRTAPDLAWRDIGNAWQCTDQQRAILQALAAWRLETARQKDKPLGFIVKDAALIQVARAEANNKAMLANIEGLHPQAVRRWGNDIIAAVQKGLATPTADIPPEMPRLDFVEGYKPLFKKVKSLVKSKAEALNVTPLFVGSRKQINEVFQWYWFVDKDLQARIAPPDLLVGWRGELLKSELEALLLPRP